MHRGLRGEFPGWYHKFWPETSGPGRRSAGFVEKFWPGKGNCFDWTSCYSSFESAGPFFFSQWGLYLIVAGIVIRNTRSPEAAESFLTTEHSLAVPELQSWHVQNRKIPQNKWLMERFAVVFVLDSNQ